MSSRQDWSCLENRFHYAPTFSPADSKADMNHLRSLPFTTTPCLLSVHPTKLTTHNISYRLATLAWHLHHDTDGRHLHPILHMTYAACTNCDTAQSCTLASRWRKAFKWVWNAFRLSVAWSSHRIPCLLARHVAMKRLSVFRVVGERNSIDEFIAFGRIRLSWFWRLSYGDISIGPATQKLKSVLGHGVRGGVYPPKNSMGNDVNSFSKGQFQGVRDAREPKRHWPSLGA